MNDPQQRLGLCAGQADEIQARGLIYGHVDDIPAVSKVVPSSAARSSECFRWSVFCACVQLSDRRITLKAGMASVSLTSAPTLLRLDREV